MTGNCHILGNFGSLLADDGLLMVAGNVVVLDAIVVEVVENTEAVFIALTVVWLGAVGSSSVRPAPGGCSASIGPSNSWVTAMVDISSSPEVPLVVPPH